MSFSRLKPVIIAQCACGATVERTARTNKEFRCIECKAERKRKYTREYYKKKREENKSL